MDNEPVSAYAADLDNLYDMMDEQIRPRDSERVLRFRSALRREIRSRLKKRGPMFSNIDLLGVKEAKKMDQDPLSYPDVLFADNSMGALSSLTDGLTPQEPDEAEFRSQQKQRMLNTAGEDMVTSYHDVRRKMADMKKTINIIISSTLEYFIYKVP